jgi:ankyrin repeat protein
LGLPVRDLEKLVYYETYIVIDSGCVAGVSDGQFISQDQYEEISLRHPDSIKTRTGAEAIRDLLQRLDLRMLEKELLSRMKQVSAGGLPAIDVGKDTKHDDTTERKGLEEGLSAIEERLRVVRWMLKSRAEPHWTVLELIPVIPPACRPIIRLVHGELLSTWPNDLYSKIIHRNNRLRKLIELNAPNDIIRNEKRVLQQTVDRLFKETITGLNESDTLFGLMPQSYRQAHSAVTVDGDNIPFPFDSLVHSKPLEDDLSAIFENLFTRYRELCESGAAFQRWNSIGDVSLRKVRMMCLDDDATLEGKEHGDLESRSTVASSLAPPSSKRRPWINARDSEGRTLLIQCVTRSFKIEDLNFERDETHTIEPLLDSGEDINAQANNGATALVTALRNLLTDAASILLKRGADPNLKSLDGYSALLTASSMFGEQAVAKDYFEILRELIEKGAEVNAQNIYGQTALLLVCKSNMRTGGIVQAIVDKLLAAGANPNVADSRGITPLMVAASKPHTVVVRRLLESGADVNAHDLKGRTAIMRAARTASTETLDQLLAYGANVDATTKSGRTALMLAAESGRAEAAQVLLAAGVNADAKDEKGNTALMFAAAKTWIAGQIAKGRDYPRIVDLLKSGRERS